MSIDISAFVANNVLELLHSSFRLSKGGNEVLLPVDLEDLLNSSADVSIPSSPSALFDSPEGAYYKGLATSSIALIVVFVLWLVALPFVGLSTKCKKLCPDFLKLICVIFGLVMAMLALFISVKGGTLLNDGANGLVSDGLEAIDAVNNISIGLLGLQTGSFGYDQVVAGTQLACSGDVAAIGTQLNGLTTGQDIRDGLQPSIETASDLNDTLNTTIEDVSPLLDSVGSGYKAITGVIITFLGVFLITIVLRYAEHKGMISEESKLAKCVTCFNKFQLGLLFTVGLIFIIILILVCAILGPVSTLGADLCLPDISSNVLALTADASGFTGDPLDQCFVLEEDIKSLSSIEIVGNTACYYTQCKGALSAFIDNGIFINNTQPSSELSDEVAATWGALAGVAFNPANGVSALCQGTILNVAQNVLPGLAAGTDAAILNARCEIVTPIARSILDVQVCNGLISGLGVIFVTWTTAAIGLMLTVLCACCIDLKTPTEEAARVLEEKQEMKGDGGAQMEAMSL